MDIKFEKIHDNLSEVSKFIKFRRKKIIAQIKTEIDSVEEFINTLHNKINILEENIDALTQQKNDLKQKFQNTYLELEQKNSLLQKINKDKATLKNRINNLRSQIGSLERKKEEMFLSLNKKDTLLQEKDFQINSLNQELANLNHKIVDLENNIKRINLQLKQKSDIIHKNDEEIHELHNNINKLNDNLKAQEKEIKNQKYEIEKFEFISNLLAAKPIENEHFEDFKRLIDNDFMEFANKENSLQEEAEAITKLQSVIKRMETLIKFSDIYDKNIIAVGGGFSAGKSEFISSFFKKNSTIKLPIGVLPTTAIPTYIVSGSRESVRGYTTKGGIIEIEPEVYSKLSHNYIKSFHFNLSDIMPLMSVVTPMYYDNICFIDTPGYNPADTNEGYTDTDIITAKKYLSHANVLIWLIGLDTSGTIPDSDIDFLNELDIDNIDLYIVANKADLRSQDDIEDILTVCEEILDDEGIEYSGISAYSSINRNEITYRRKSLYSFFDEKNIIIESHKDILSDLNNIFNMYQDAITNDISFRKDILKSFKSLELDFLESSFEQYDSKLINRLNKLKRYFDIKILEQHLMELSSVKKMILESVNAIFDDLKSQKMR